MSAVCHEIVQCCDDDVLKYSESFVELWHTADSGTNDAASQTVAQLINTRRAPIVILGGDNDYLNPHDYALSVEPYYGLWLERGQLYPIYGNHDWDFDNGQAYLDYFTFLNAQRYYHRRFGPLHCYFMDSGFDTAMVNREPDGNEPDSFQAGWLADRVAESNAPWKVAFIHHPPYASDTTHGSTLETQWDWAGMGIHAVISGHAHVYERLLIGGVNYIVNGLGGGAIYNFGTPVNGSLVRYNDFRGALRIRATINSLKFLMVNVNGVTVDSTELTT